MIHFNLGRNFLIFAVCFRQQCLIKITLFYHSLSLLFLYKYIIWRGTSFAYHFYTVSLQSYAEMSNDDFLQAYLLVKTSILTKWFYVYRSDKCLPSTSLGWPWALRPILCRVMAWRTCWGFLRDLLRSPPWTVLCPTVGTQVNNQAVKPNYQYLKVPYG
jgi:predicted membrane channel-forming protein YqfA (hemolysin III family)